MLKITDVKEIIKKNLLARPEDRVEICILGAPGIGKSSIVFQLAKEMNKSIVLFSASTKTREDVAGIPVYNFASLVNGLVNRKEINNEVIHTRPKYLDADILFIDEITNCAEHEFKWISQMITERRVGEHQLNPNCYIICAGNRPEHSELANDLPAIFASRLILLDVVTDKQGFLKRAFEEGWDPRVIAYIDQYPNTIENIKYKSPNEGYACPRSFEKVSKILKMFDSDKYIQRMMILGALGSADGTEFIAYMDKITNKIPYNEIETAFRYLDKKILDKYMHLDLDSKIANLYDIYSIITNIANGKKEKTKEDINSLFMSVYVTANEKLDRKLSTLYCSLLEMGGGQLTTTYNLLLEKIQKDKDYQKEIGMDLAAFIKLYETQFNNIVKIRKYNN